MPEGNPRPNARGDDTRLDDLVATVEALRADIRELRASLAAEVRTRRVVLAESDGFERLVAAANGGFGHVTLFGRTGADHTTCVELFANDPIDASGAHVGVALTDHDEVVATFEAVQGRPPTIWLAADDHEDDDPRPP